MWVWYSLTGSLNDHQNLDIFHVGNLVDTLPVVDSSYCMELCSVMGSSKNEVKIGQDELVKNECLLGCVNNIGVDKRCQSEDLNKKQEKIGQKQIIVNLMGKKTGKIERTKKQTRCSDFKIESWNNPGRNSTSNIFRVFIKLCSKSKNENFIRKQFEIISRLNSFFITFNYFKIRLAEVAPSTSNYINLKEFRKTCEGQSQFCKAFRCLFHWFVKDFALAHILTLKSKGRMAKQSIACFISNLHEIENEIWGKDEGKDEQECRNSTQQVSQV